MRRLHWHHHFTKTDSWMWMDWVRHDGFGLKPRLVINKVIHGLPCYFEFTWWKFHWYWVENPDRYKERKGLLSMKLLLLAFAIAATAGCVNQTINGIPLEEGDTKTYETKDYLIIYRIVEFNNFGQAVWEFDEIRNKKDSIYGL